MVEEDLAHLVIHSALIAPQLAVQVLIALTLNWIALLPIKDPLMNFTSALVPF